jgi:hypothetical protein
VKWSVYQKFTGMKQRFSIRNVLRPCVSRFKLGKATHGIVAEKDFHAREAVWECKKHDVPNGMEQHLKTTRSFYTISVC